MPIPTAVRTLIQPDLFLRELKVSAGWRVADFGCGPGYYLVPAARFVGREGRVVGIDIRTEAVDEARRRLERERLADHADVFRADLARAGASGLPDGWAHLVILVGVLYQSDPRALLKEASRVVRPTDGRVAVVEWEEVATPLGPPKESRVPKTTVLASAKTAGLTFLQTFTPSPSQYGVIFAKTHLVDTPES